jgi:amino acid permease
MLINPGKKHSQGSLPRLLAYSYILLLRNINHRSYGPDTDANLLGAQKTGALGAARSPWFIAISEAGIPLLSSIINAVILTSAASSGSTFLYNGSRYLYALAQNRQAPKFLLECTEAKSQYTVSS